MPRNIPRQFTCFHSAKRQEFYFSTDHLQPKTDETFVPVSFTLPMWVVPREAFPDGILRTPQDYIEVFCTGETQIPNPDVRFVEIAGGTGVPCLN